MSGMELLYHPEAVWNHSAIIILLFSPILRSQTIITYLPMSWFAGIGEDLHAKLVVAPTYEVNYCEYMS
jgi:hypothetical protein